MTKEEQSVRPFSLLVIGHWSLGFGHSHAHAPCDVTHAVGAVAVGSGLNEDLILFLLLFVPAPLLEPGLQFVG
jgi:hypothetical protein